MNLERLIATSNRIIPPHQLGVGFPVVAAAAAVLLLLSVRWVVMQVLDGSGLLGLGMSGPTNQVKPIDSDHIAVSIRRSSNDFSRTNA